MFFRLSYLQPITLVLFQILTTAIVIGFTSPSAHTIRSLGLILVAVVAYSAILTTARHVSSVLLAGVFAGNATTYFLRYLDLALLDKWSFADEGPARLKRLPSPKFQKKSVRVNAAKKPATVWQRLQFGLNVTLSPRQVNTPYQVKNVPAWSRDEPPQVPSKGKFLRRTTINILLSYLIIDLCSLGVQPEQNAIWFSDEKVPLLTRSNGLGLEEIVIRIFASLSVWLNIFCTFTICHGLLVLLAVGSGWHEVKDWPPPFGSLSEANSVRRYWG